MRANSLIGRTFGRLRVICRSGTSSGGNALWSCTCACGSQTTARADHLKAGRILSCGCLRSENNAGRAKAKIDRKYKEYAAWEARQDAWAEKRTLRSIYRGMRRRCENPKAKAYQWYGARGITVCDRWKSFDNFFNDMYPRPGGEYSIDRIDNNGPYSSDNCRWALAGEQNANKRKHEGLATRARQRGFVETTIRARMAKGETEEQALSRPARKYVRHVGA